MTVVAHENEGQRKGIAMGVSLAVHALLILFFIIYKIITPIPPFPEKEGGGAGYELALGFSELGMGENQNVTDLSTPAAQQESAPPPEEQAEVLTSDVDESDVTTPPKKDDKPKTDKPKEKPKPTAEEIAREKQRKIDELMGNKGTGQVGQGANDTPGDAGGANGSPTGTGQGTGVGVYSGKGFNLEGMGGRNVRGDPVFKSDPERSGKVAMDIVVNREGKVIRATPNYKRSTINDAKLVALAHEGAMSTTFTPDFKANTGSEQRGLMIFNFEVH